MITHLPEMYEKKKKEMYEDSSFSTTLAALFFCLMLTMLTLPASGSFPMS